MGDFNRGGRSGGRSFERRGFNDRGSRGPAPYRSGTGPVEMHRATCDKCHKDCEVPFRPTSGKPIYCKNCFESRNFDRPADFEDRQMFEAVCDECRNSCKVPFQPSGGKPVYCSNCFGEKKEGGSRDREQFKSQPQYTEQFEQLNNKLDKILMMLAPTEVVKDHQLEEQTVNTKETKAAKKKPSKKKS